MKKRKPKPFRASKAVKSLARERIGTPKPTRRLPDEKKDATRKRKPTLGELLEEG
jgi:hypothetical protein